MNPIQQFLQENGFESGRYGGCRHSCGIPQLQGTSVRPSYSPVDGAHTLIVTPTHVMRFTCRIPYNYNDWMCVETRKYTSKEQLLTILSEMTNQPQGCWA